MSWLFSLLLLISTLALAAPFDDPVSAETELAQLDSFRYFNHHDVFLNTLEATLGKLLIVEPTTILEVVHRNAATPLDQETTYAQNLAKLLRGRTHTRPSNVESIVNYALRVATEAYEREDRNMEIRGYDDAARLDEILLPLLCDKDTDQERERVSKLIAKARAAVNLKKYALQRSLRLKDYEFEVDAVLSALPPNNEVAAINEKRFVANALWTLQHEKTDLTVELLVQYNVDERLKQMAFTPERYESAKQLFVQYLQIDGNYIPASTLQEFDRTYGSASLNFQQMLQNARIHANNFRASKLQEFDDDTKMTQQLELEQEFQGLPNFKLKNAVYIARKTVKIVNAVATKRFYALEKAVRTGGYEKNRFQKLLYDAAFFKDTETLDILLRYATNEGFAAAFNGAANQLFDVGGNDRDGLERLSQLLQDERAIHPYIDAALETALKHNVLSVLDVFKKSEVI